MTQCQIQKLVEEIATLRYEIQELRKKIINKQNRGENELRRNTRANSRVGSCRNRE